MAHPAVSVLHVEPSVMGAFRVPKISYRLLQVFKFQGKTVSVDTVETNAVVAGFCCAHCALRTPYCGSWTHHSYQKLFSSQVIALQAMEAALIVAFVLQDWADGALIAGLLLLNATISYIEEASAVGSAASCAGRAVLDLYICRWPVVHKVQKGGLLTYGISSVCRTRQSRP
jgi:hypothetical protein